MNNLVSTMLVSNLVPTMLVQAGIQNEIRTCLVGT